MGGREGESWGRGGGHFGDPTSSGHIYNRKDKGLVPVLVVVMVVVEVRGKWMG